MPVILQVISSLETKTGGPARSVSAMCDGLAHLGFDVTLVTISDAESEMVVPKHPSVKIKWLKPLILRNSPFSFVKTFFEIRLLLKKKRFDLIHSHGIWDLFNSAVFLASYFSGIKHVLSPRGMLEPWALSEKKWKKKIAWLCYQKFICMNSFIVSTAVNERTNIVELLPDSSPYIVPNFLYVPKSFPKRSVFRKAGINFLFLSRVHKKKGLEVLFKALGRISSADWILRIVGEGQIDYVNQIKNLSQSLGISEKVIFVGPVLDDRKWQEYIDTDFFILPTYSENFGNVILEALSAGRPVITTKGTPWKNISEKGCGWWIDLSVDDLEIAITEALTLTDAKYKRMSASAVSLSDRYSEKNVMKVLAKTYDHILSIRM